MNKPDAPKKRGQTVDPCPICGVSQETHWRCKRCTSRGHILGHSNPTSDYCDACVRDMRKAREVRRDAAD